MSFTEQVCTFDEDQLAFIKYLLCPAMPLHCWRSVISGEQHAYVHEFVARVPEKNKSAGIIMSPHYPAALSLFRTCCKQMGIEFKDIYRMALNSTGFSLKKHGVPHVDHTFPHKSFLLYLNDFTGGATYLMDENHNIVAETKPEKFKAATWGGEIHAQGFCGDEQRRVVLVVTYE